MRFVNDSKATNIEAALRAIESFEPGLVADPRRPVQGRRLRRSARARWWSDRPRWWRSARRRRWCAQALAPAVAVHDAGDMVAAVRTAFALASPGETVLLAPACASFDMFKDYAERGQVFKREVARLADEWTGAGAVASGIGSR